MKKKLFTLLCCLTLVAGMFAGCGGGSGTDGGDGGGDGATPQVWKLAHSEAADTVMDMYANKFKELVESKIDGVTVEVYPVGQLGDSAAQTELLQTGGIQFEVAAVAEVGTVIPASQAMSLNFLFSDDSAVNDKVLTQGEGTKYLNGLFEDKQIHVIDWFSLGFQNWTSNKPLHTVADFKGFKMRVMNSPLIIANYDAFKASPTAVPFMETYSSLQMNMVDGTEQPLNAIEEMKFYEVQKYITESKHAILPSFTGVNVDFWNNLPDDQKAVITDEIIPELQKYEPEILAQVQEEKLAKIMEMKPDMIVEQLTDEEREAFKEASLPVHAKVEELCGADGKQLMDLILKDVENFSK